MSEDIRLNRFRAARNASVLYRALLDVPFDQLDHDTLIRLKSITRAKISADRFETVPEELLQIYSRMLSGHPLDLPELKPGSFKIGTFLSFISFI